MGSKLLPHDVSPFLQKLRNLLLGREHTSYLRFPERIAARTQPPPSLPDGCNSKIANNYYCRRDGRRLVQPEEILFVNTKSKKITGAKSESSELVAPRGSKTPGKLYLPDLKNLN